MTETSNTMKAKSQRWEALNPIERCILCGERGMCQGRQRKEHARSSWGEQSVKLGVERSIKALTELMEKL
jgi:hypothetical protein